MYRHGILATRTVATSQPASDTVDAEYATRSTACVEVISLITDGLPDRGENTQHTPNWQGKRYYTHLIVSVAVAAATLTHLYEIRSHIKCRPY